MTKIYILPLLAAFTFSLNAQAEKLMTKEEFYAKHNIVGDSLIPLSFDMDALKKALMENGYNEKSANRAIEKIKEDLQAPIIFEGFNTPVPNDTVEFCDYRSHDCLKKIGFSQEEIDKFFPPLSDDILKENGLTMTDKKIRERWHSDCPDPNLHRYFKLVARVGHNLYLQGESGDCGSFGCPVELYLKKDGQLTRYPIDMIFDCFNPAVPFIHDCRIYGGFRYDWRNDAISYEPLLDLFDRYITISMDYVYHYILRRDTEND